MSYSDLIISEYIEGSSNNKAIELFNGTGAAINLAAAGYVLQFYSNGSASAGLTISLTGTVAAGDVYVIAQSSANATILAQADQTNGAGWFNGNDAVVVRKGGAAGAVVDSLGQAGFDPGSQWGTGLVSTQDNTLRRLTTVTTGDTTISDLFTPATEWEGFANDTFGDLGMYTPAVTTTPLVSVSATDGSAAEAGMDPGTLRFTRTGDTTAALTVTYTLGGTASADDYTPGLFGTLNFGIGDAFVDVTLTPADDAAAEGLETVTVTLQDGDSYDLGASNTATVNIADNDSAPTKIHAVQGSGALSPLTGQIVTIEAIVVGDFQGGNRLGGFFVQEEDADADANPATSEGLFIFQGASGTAVNVGDKVRVTGTVTDFGSFSKLTELTTITDIGVISSGNPLPAATVLSFPLATVASLEAYEGMRVQINTPLAVTSTDDIKTFGNVLLSSAGGNNAPGTDARLDIFTQYNAPSVGGYAAYLEQIALRRIVLDDGSDDSNVDPIAYGRDGNPLSAANTLRAGDTVAMIEGILDDRFGNADVGAYRIQPTATVDFDATNARTTAPEVGGSLRVASFNVLNYFNGNGAGGGFPTPRGADNAAEFARQQSKIVAAIVGLDADIVGLVEIENDGYGAASAIASLVNALNAAAGPGLYAFINPGAADMGGDQIAVGFIYKPAIVTPKGAAATLTSAFVDPDGGGFESGVQRPSLAQTFEVNATGAVFTPVINHLKSKGSAAAGAGNADAFDGQGESNGTRTRAADTLMDWLKTDPTGSGDKDFLILGDLNAYAMEDPVQQILEGADDSLGGAGGADDFINLIGSAGYSYGFNGGWGSLDHALASGNLAGQVTGAADWHINADEPEVLDYNLEGKNAGQQVNLFAPDAYRSSDHDPIVIGLNLGLTKPGTTGNDPIAGSSGNDELSGGAGRDTIGGGDGRDTITGGSGRDSLAGGSGADSFVYTSLVDAGDVIFDFQLGLDRIVINQLLASVGYAGGNPADTSHFKALALGGKTYVMFDPDGMAGPAAARTLVTLLGVSTDDEALLLNPPG